MSIPPAGHAASMDGGDPHATAVKRSLAWAQESADRGDYEDALGWIEVVEAIGEQLPAGYQTRRLVWARARTALGENPD